MTESEVQQIREELKAFKLERFQRDKEIDARRDKARRWMITISIPVVVAFIVSAGGFALKSRQDIAANKSSAENLRLTVASRATHETRLAVLEAEKEAVRRQIAEGFALIRSDIRDMREDLDQVTRRVR